MKDSELELQLTSAIRQWEDATRGLLRVCFMLGIYDQPQPLWLTPSDKKFLTDLDQAFTDRKPQ
jgi:hypothetical protein